MQVFLCEYCEIFKNTYFEEQLWTAASNWFSQEIKGILMQIWKSPYTFVFIWRWYPKSFAFLILRILELFARKICKCLKK